MNVVFYMRMSTEKQDNSIDSQREALKRHAGKNGMFIVGEYVDEGVSGRKASRRPGFLQMIEDSQKGLFQIVLVYDSSRFARNLEESIVYKSELKRNGVRLISITEPTPDEDTMLITDAMLGAINEMYSRKLSKAVARGMAYKAERGYFMHPAPYGYRNMNGVLVPDNDEAEIVKLVFSLFLDAPFYHSAAVKLNLDGVPKRSGAKWNSADIKHMLLRHTYAGDIYNNGQIFKGRHEPIIDHEVFDKVQALISAKPKRRERSAVTYKHWLSGIMRCGKCGSGMNHATDWRGNRSFRCRGNANGSCLFSNFISVGKAESLFFKSFDTLFSCVGEIGYFRFENCAADKISALIPAVKKAKARMKRIELAYENGVDTLSEYGEKKKLALAALNELSDKLAALECEKAKEKAFSPIHKPTDIPSIFFSEAYSTEQKSIAVKSVIDRIVLDKYEGRFDVYFK